MKTHFWPIVLIVLVGSIIYGNTLNVPFHFDDQYNIQNPALRMESLSLEQFKKTLFDGALKSRPICNLSFAFNYFIGQYRVQGYHLVNIGIHICTGIFLYLFLQITLNLAVNRQQYKKHSAIALMTSLLWLAHPVATQSVTYIVQRMNSMAAMFFMLTMLLYAVGRNRQLAFENDRANVATWLWFVAGGISGLLAIGSKEIAATIPLFLFLYEWYFFQDLSWDWLKKKLYWLVGIFIILVCITYAYTNGQIIDRIFNSCGGRDFTTMERVLTQFRVVIYYISLIFYPNPNRLALDYDFPVSISLLSPITTLTSLFAIVVLVALAILLARRERLISFCILWFFGNLIIESSVICLEIIFEHRTYLPSMFLLLLFVAMAYRVGRQHSKLVSLLLVLLTVLFGYWTFERNKVWQNPLALWSDSILKYPDKARSHNNLGLSFAEIRDFERAEQEIERALQIKGNNDEFFSNLAGVYLRQGKKQQAEIYLQQAIQLNPASVAARLSLGGLLREKGQYKEAVNQFREALRRAPGHLLVNKNLGNALLRSGHPSKALPYLKEVLLQSPDDTEVLLDIAESLIRLGRIDEAIDTYQNILYKDGKNVAAHYHIALLLRQKNREREALLHYREADRLMRFPAEVKYDLGNLLFQLGELNEAEKTYREFLELMPTLAMTYNNMGLVLVNQGRLQEAIELFQMAVKIAPSFQLAANNLQLATEQLKLMDGKNTSIIQKKESGH